MANYLSRGKGLEGRVAIRHQNTLQVEGEHREIW
jgi:hypothetical protein